MRLPNKKKNNLNPRAHEIVKKAEIKIMAAKSGSWRKMGYFYANFLDDILTPKWQHG